MKNLLIIPLLLLLLAGCNGVNGPGSVQPSEQSDTTKNYNVRFLFEVDGIRVYSFFDDRTVYFTNTAGQIGYEYSTTRRNGKHTSTSTHYVETLCNSSERPQP